jgi:phospholipase/lecithinase/hemolysin
MIPTPLHEVLKPLFGWTRLSGIAAIWFMFSASTPDASASDHKWTKLFAFGDSYSDSGAGYIDGNGPTAIVYAAQALNIPFTHANDPEAGSKGLNYAVSGARTGVGKGKRIKDNLLGYGMQNQVDDFLEGVDAGDITFDPEHTLFFIAGGLNDRPLKTTTTEKNLTRIVRRLHEAGARHFFIATLPEQIPAFEDVAKRLNPALKELPGKIMTALPEANVRSSRWGEYFDLVMQTPTPFGIINTTDACAGRALFDEDDTPQGDPETYYFYHIGHPSTATHRHVGKMLAKELRLPSTARATN